VNSNSLGPLGAHLTKLGNEKQEAFELSLVRAFVVLALLTQGDL